MLSKTDDNLKLVEWATNGIKVLDESSHFLIHHTKDIKAKKERSFEDAKGFAIAAYQEFLEKEWMAELRGKYAIVVNQDILKGLTK